MVAFILALSVRVQDVEDDYDTVTQDIEADTGTQQIEDDVYQVNEQITIRCTCHPLSKMELACKSIAIEYLV